MPIGSWSWSELEGPYDRRSKGFATFGLRFRALQGLLQNHTALEVTAFTEHLLDPDLKILRRYLQYESRGDPGAQPPMLSEMGVDYMDNECRVDTSPLHYLSLLHHTPEPSQCLHDCFT